MITRILEAGINKLLENFPVVGLLGPRQCGKSTLAREILMLGSASRDLLRQSSETLAGRIVYKHLTPFLWPTLWE